MGNVKALLAEAKQKSGVESDYALAKVLDLPQQRISDYNKGKAAPDEYACEQIAQATGKTFECVVALVKADTEKDEKRREYWRKKLYALGQIAACLVLALGAVVTLKMTTISPEAAPLLAYASGMFCIMSILIRFGKVKAQLRRIGFPSGFSVFIREVRQVPA